MATKVNVGEGDIEGGLGAPSAPAEKAIEVGQKASASTVYVTYRGAGPLVLDPGPKQVIIVQGMNVIDPDVWARNRKLAPIAARIEIGDLMEHTEQAGAVRLAKRIADAGSPPLIPPSAVDRRIDLDAMASTDIIPGRLTSSTTL